MNRKIVIGYILHLHLIYIFKNQFQTQPKLSKISIYGAENIIFDIKEFYTRKVLSQIKLI